jgi:O-acetylhomoserine/O-acetylserine sulfhydrylase-like pyridoxal-dependent enzyme
MMVRDSLAACRQLTDLTLVSTPVEELASLLLALPPSLRKLDIRDCAGFLQSDAFFQCVADGGLRQLERLHVRLQRNEYDQQKVAAWLAQQRVCVPWINAALRKI